MVLLKKPSELTTKCNKSLIFYNQIHNITNINHIFLKHTKYNLNPQYTMHNYL